MKIGWFGRVQHGLIHTDSLTRVDSSRRNNDVSTQREERGKPYPHMKMELDGDIMRGVVHARMESELRRRSNAGCCTRAHGETASTA
ncbi:unnamed protein product [Brassica rapa]|uniref:Uncharacterized protein n=1 Tax=Brassica campestris TaxID=3711 RepID=A0A3P6AIP6_BRACM|nr:unnamed protein product [Brassica rapa]VDC84168.1 unnamed protein product [Brassica rapa]